MANQNIKKLYIFIALGIIIAFIISPAFGFFAIWILIVILTRIKKDKSLTSYLSKFQQMAQESSVQEVLNTGDPLDITNLPSFQNKILPTLTVKTRLEKRKKYLHIALNIIN